MLEINEIYQGFKLIEKTDLKDIKAEGLIFEHIKTKAGLFIIKNEDKNKTFSISFKTPPKDETGLTHILEHSVLSGSKKYPVKSPFLELRKSSLSTFLNAMTFSDKTMYPVSSINDIDFRNLMDAYLDAVFNPLVHDKKEVFLQEGWRIEIENEEDELNYNGIVYNEMKGAYSSPDRNLINGIKNSLYPDTSYGLDSGGNPDHIIELNYEDFCKFHDDIYHPTNSYAFLYGDIDILENLKYLNEEYFSKYEEKHIENEIMQQTPFEEVRYKEYSYALGKEQDPKNKTYLSKNYVIGKITDKNLLFSMMILEKIFFDNMGSPIKNRLIAEGIAEDIDGFYYTVGIQPMFSIIARNSDSKHFERFKDIIDEVLNEIVANGLNKEMLYSAINYLEFRLRENNSSANRGIGYAQTAMDSWLYGEKPTLFFEYEEVVNFLRSKIETDYFETLIKEYMLDNKHSSEVLILPKPGLEEVKEREIRDKLAEKKEKLSDAEIKELIAETEKLKKYQDAEDSKESLDTIPALEIEDINPKQEVIPTEIKEDGKMLYHPIFTNSIAYMDFYFNSLVMEQEKIKYIYLLGDILGKLDTEEYSYEELTNKVDLNTGGIDFTVLPIENFKTKELMAFFRASGKCFANKAKDTLELINEIITKSRFDNKKRFKDIISEIKAFKESELLEDSMNVAQNRLGSYFNKVAAYQEQGNIEYLHFIKHIFENFEDEYQGLAEELKEILSVLVNKNQLVSSLTIDEDQFDKVNDEMLRFKEQLPSIDIEAKEYSFDLQNKKEGLLIPAKVQYVIKGYNYNELGYEFNGTLKVLTKILNTDYLWQQLRVVGGAYGGFVGITPLGTVMFSSYRDPNLKRSIEVYNGAAEYLRNFNTSEKEMRKFVIGTIGGMDTPANPRTRGRIANLHYFQGIDQDMLQKTREEVLKTSQEGIRNLADMFDRLAANDYLCVIGNESKIKEDSEIFNNITSLV